MKAKKHLFPAKSEPLTHHVIPQNGVLKTKKLPRAHPKKLLAAEPLGPTVKHAGNFLCTGISEVFCFAFLTQTDNLAGTARGWTPMEQRGSWSKSII